MYRANLVKKHVYAWSVHYQQKRVIKILAGGTGR